MIAYITDVSVVLAFCYYTADVRELQHVDLHIACNVHVREAPPCFSLSFSLCLCVHFVHLCVCFVGTWRHGSPPGCRRPCTLTLRREGIDAGRERMLSVCPTWTTSSLPRWEGLGEGPREKVDVYTRAI